MVKVSAEQENGALLAVTVKLSFARFPNNTPPSTDVLASVGRGEPRSLDGAAGGLDRAADASRNFRIAPSHQDAGRAGRRGGLADHLAAGVDGGGTAAARLLASNRTKGWLANTRMIPGY
jgi:hypothetical protein